MTKDTMERFIKDFGLENNFNTYSNVSYDKWDKKDSVTSLLDSWIGSYVTSIEKDNTTDISSVPSDCSVVRSSDDLQSGTSKISFDVETEMQLSLESKVNYLSSRLENLYKIVNVCSKSMDQVYRLESQVSELQNEVKRLRDIVVSYNIQSDDVELAGFFDELDKS